MRAIAAICALMWLASIGSASAQNDDIRMLNPEEVAAALDGRQICYDEEAGACEAIATPVAVDTRSIELREYALIDIDLMLQGEMGDFIRSLPTVQENGSLFAEMARLRGSHRYIKLVDTQRLQHASQHNFWCESVPAANGFERAGMWFSSSQRADVAGDVRVPDEMRARFAAFFLQAAEEPAVRELMREDPNLGYVIVALTTGVTLCSRFWAGEADAATMQVVTTHLPDGRLLEPLTARANTFGADTERTLRAD